MTGTMTRTFTFEGVTCVLKRPKMKDAEKRERIKAILDGKPFAFVYADFQVCTLSIQGADIELLTDTSDIGSVENGYYSFLELDEPFVMKWQDEKSRLLNAITVTDGGEKKS